MSALGASGSGPEQLPKVEPAGDDCDLANLTGDTQALVLDAMGAAIIAHDLTGRVSFFNSGAEKLTGFNRQEVVGKKCHDVFADGFCGEACLFKDQTPPPLADATVDTMQVTHCTGPKTLQRTTLPVRSATGSPAGVLIIARDSDCEFERSRASHTLSQAPEALVAPADSQFHGLTGTHPKMREIFTFIRQVARTEICVQIAGATGTGKELAALAIHRESRRARAPFVAVNCGALPEGLLESELFGHRRGAFTGAVQNKRGRFELAHGGTIFLDEVGELNPAMQVRLLRVLEDHRIEPLGSERCISVDVRVISATNRDLAEEVRRGTFREDLYFRLCVIPIHLPLLRERSSDIPLLAAAFLERVADETHLPPARLSAQALAALVAAPWPGNVRELLNALRYAAVRAAGNTIELQHLPPTVVADKASKRPPFDSDHRGRPRKLTSEAVADAMSTAQGNKAEAARLLGVGRSTLYRALRAR